MKIGKNNRITVDKNSAFAVIYCLRLLMIFIIIACHPASALKHPQIRAIKEPALIYVPFNVTLMLFNAFTAFNASQKAVKSD